MKKRLLIQAAVVLGLGAWRLASPATAAAATLDPCGSQCDAWCPEYNICSGCTGRTMMICDDQDPLNQCGGLSEHVWVWCQYDS